MRRNDSPRLKTLRPEAYEYVGPIIPARERALVGTHPLFQRLVVEYEKRTRWAREHSDSWGREGRCDLCGAHFQSGGIFRHRATDRSLTVGHQCEYKVFGVLCTHTEILKDLRRRNRKGLETARRQEKAREMFAGLDAMLATRDRTIADIRYRFESTGRISQAQVDLVKTIIRRRAEAEARRADEAKDARPVPTTTDRLTLQGQVLAVAERDGYNGPCWKMLLRVPVATGGFFKLWGTVPKALPLADLRGRQVQLKARVEPSKDDATFGFFSRPTGAKVLQEAS